MEQNIKDFIFMSHFNPKREPDISPIKPCPFCKCTIYSIVDNNRICFRCGKVIQDKPMVYKE